MSTSELGEELRRARQLLGLSLKAVAEPAGMSATSLHKLEAGLVDKPEPSRLKALADVLGISYADLFTLAGHPMPETDRRVRSSRTQPKASIRRAALDPEKLSDTEVEELSRYLSFLRSKTPPGT